MDARHRMIAYGALCVVGTAMPLLPFLPWLVDNGLDVQRFAGDLFANRVSAFFAWDVVVSP